jgi:hypothetical protein
LSGTEFESEEITSDLREKALRFSEKWEDLTAKAAKTS